MNNIQAKQLKLIEIASVPTSTIFPYLLKPIADYTQIIFDKHNTPIYMVKPRAFTRTPVQVRNGKIIVKVSYLAYDHILSGTIITKDHYKYGYQAKVTLQITNSWMVAIEYIQGRDPVKQTINFISSMFEQHASSSNFEAFRSQKFPSTYWNNLHAASLGITIEQQGEIDFVQAAQYIGYDGEILRIREQKEIQLERLRAEKEIQVFKNRMQQEQERCRQDFKRQEEVKDTLHKLRNELRSASKQKFEAILHQKPQEGSVSNNSAEEIAQIHFHLLSIFDDSNYIASSNILDRENNEDPIEDASNKGEVDATESDEAEDDEGEAYEHEEDEEEIDN